VAYLFKARTVEPEQEPLLANSSETTFVSKQRLGKHVPAATGTHAIIEVLLETVFSTRSVKRGISQEKHYVSSTKRSQQRLFGEIFAVYSENHMKHKKALCGQNAEF
jgi:hypothetical protein